MARVGTAYLQIVASLRGVRKQIQDELSGKDFTIPITPKLTGVRKQIQDELNKASFNIKLDPKLTGVRTAINTGLKEPFKIKLDPDMTGVRTKIDTLLKDAFTVRLDVKTLGLRRAIQTELFRADFNINIEPQLRGLRLKIQNELNRADFTIRVRAVTTRVDTGGDADGISRISRDSDRASSGLGRLEQRIATFATRVRNLATVGQLFGALARGLALVGSIGLGAVSSITALLPVLGALVVAAGAAAAAIMLLPAAFGAAAAGIGVLALGFDGVFDAIGAGWKAANVSSTRGAQQQRAAAERVADAQVAVTRAVENRNRQVGDAEQSLTRAEQEVGQTVTDVARKVSEAQADVGRAIANRAQAVQTAERSLIRAQESARDAQERLNRAREDAVERLRDMRGELEDAELSEERAAIQLLRARERLAALDQDDDALDRREALLGVAEAENAVEDAADASAKAQREHIVAQREGVEGSRAVVDATRDVEEANRRVGDEQADLRRAQTEGTAAIIAAQAKVTQVQVEGQQQIGEANQRVGDAQVALQRAQADGARAITEAQRNLTNAQLQQADTVQTELRNFQEAMARLSPAARALVNEVLRLKPAFDALQLGVQERLLAGVAGHFGTLATLYLPQLNHWLGLIADSFNRAFINLARFFEQTDTQRRFGEAMSNIQRTLEIIAQTVQPIVDLFFTLFVAGSRVLPRLAEGIKGVADRFNAFIQGAEKSGGLNDFFEAATTNILKILDIVEDLIVSFGAIFNAATLGGGGILDGIKEVTGAMKDFFTSAEGQTMVRDFFFFLGETMKNLAPGLKVLLAALGDFLDRIGPRLPEVATSLSTIFEKIAPILVDLAVIVFEAFAAVLKWMSELPPEVLTTLVVLFTTIALLPNIGGTVASAVLLFGGLGKLAGIVGIAGKLGGIAKGIGGIALALTLLDTALRLPAILDENFPGLYETVDDWLNRELAPALGLAPSPRRGGGARPRPGSPGAIHPRDVRQGGGGARPAPGTIGAGDAQTPESFFLSPAEIGARLAKLFEPITKWWADVLKGWEGFKRDIKKINEDIGQWIWDHTFGWIAVQWETVFVPWWNAEVVPRWEGFKAWIYAVNEDIGRWIWDHTFGWVAVQWNTVFVPWWNSEVVPRWEGFKAWIYAVNEDIGRWVWDHTFGWIAVQWNTVFVPWWNTEVVPRYEGFKAWIYRVNEDIGRWVWDHTFGWIAVQWETVFVPWWNREVVTRWNEMWDGIETRVGQATAWLGQKWYEIQNLFAIPINWVIDHVWNGAFKNLWDAANGMLGGALGAFKTAGRVGAQPFFPSSGTGKGASTFGLARGGVIPGYRPGRDSVPAMLSPGEAIMRPEWARAIGTGDINKMNKIARKRGRAGIWNYLYGGDPDGPGLLAKRGRKSPPMPGFAQGGVVTDDAAIRRAQDFARGMHGTPYQMAGFGRGGIDCTAFLSAITNVLLSRAPFSARFASGAFSGGRSVWGFTPGLTSAWSIGVLPGNPGHAAGTLGGINVESSSPEGARYGGNAMGASNNYFPYKFSLPQVGGIFVGGPGGGSMDIGALIQGWFDQFLKPVRESIGGAFGGKTTGLFGLPGGFIDTLIKGATTFLMEKASALFGAIMGATSAETPGIVKIISDVARGRFGANALQAAVIGVATGIVESNLQNLNRGDRDSLGVFQQRPSQGWGTPQQVTNVTYAAGKFFEKFPGNWMSWEPGALAQSIQRSAFGWKYAPQMGRARQLVGQFGGFDRGGILPPGLSLAYNGTRQPERVLTDTQWQTLSAAAQGGDFRIKSGELEIVGDGLARIVDARLERVGTSVSLGRRV